MSNTQKKILSPLAEIDNPYKHTLQNDIVVGSEVKDITFIGTIKTYSAGAMNGVELSNSTESDNAINNAIIHYSENLSYTDFYDEEFKSYSMNRLFSTLNYYTVGDTTTVTCSIRAYDKETNTFGPKGLDLMQGIFNININLADEVFLNFNTFVVTGTHFTIYFEYRGVTNEEWFIKLRDFLNKNINTQIKYTISVKRLYKLLPLNTYIDFSTYEINDVYANYSNIYSTTYQYDIEKISADSYKLPLYAYGRYCTYNKNGLYFNSNCYLSIYFEYPLNSESVDITVYMDKLTEKLIIFSNKFQHNYNYTDNSTTVTIPTKYLNMVEINGKVKCAPIDLSYSIIGTTITGIKIITK